MMRRMSSSLELATIDGSGTGGMGQWASAEEEEGGREGGRAGSEHVLLNVSQLRRAQQQQQQQQQQAVVTPQEEEDGGRTGGVGEEKEEAGTGGGGGPTIMTTTSDHYGTFSPDTSPGGSRREKPQQQQQRHENEEEEEKSSISAAAAAAAGTRSTTPPPLLLPAKNPLSSRPSNKRSTSTSSSSTTTTAAAAAAAAAAAVMSPATAAVQAPVIFKERWKQKEARIRQRSQIGHLPGWRLVPVIVKSNDDLRQEQFASQLLHQIAQVLRHAEVPVWMRPYDIIATSFDGGLIEAIPDTVSLDALRRNDPNYTTLPDFFERFWGRGEGLGRARQCFLESLAAYSIVCFLLQVKDRHNGNILLDAEGHLIHIDFGFLLSSSPGNVNFERAPFKLTAEMVDVLGGPRSALFKRFRELCVKAFLELRRQRHKIILLVEMVVSGNENLPCFGGRPEATVEALRQRFQPELNDRACSDFVNGLIDDSVGSWSTRWYDVYQRAFVL